MTLVLATPEPRSSGHWHARLQLDYTHRQGTRLQHQHQGPLRVLQSLYPEGPDICHNVLIHPPGGLVGGDVLDIQGSVGANCHALIGTPGATRFYRSEGPMAQQRVRFVLQENARLEWLPLETIAYPGCVASNHWSAQLAPSAELMCWEVTALGLPDAEQAFERGELHQRLEIEGLWLDEGRIHAQDKRLLDHALGLGGRRCMGTLVWACGSPMSAARQALLLEQARLGLDGFSGATCPNPHVLVVRTLADRVEPVMRTLQTAWAQLRPAVWGLPPVAPRVWAV